MGVFFTSLFSYFLIFISLKSSVKTMHWWLFWNIVKYDYFLYLIILSNTRYYVISSFVLYNFVYFLYQFFNVSFGFFLFDPLIILWFTLLVPLNFPLAICVFFYSCWKLNYLICFLFFGILSRGIYSLVHSVKWALQTLNHTPKVNLLFFLCF